MPTSSEAMRSSHSAMYNGCSPPSTVRASQYSEASGSEPRTLLCSAEMRLKWPSPSRS